VAWAGERAGQRWLYDLAFVTVLIAAVSPIVAHLFRPVWRNYRLRRQIEDVLNEFPEQDEPLDADEPATGRAWGGHGERLSPAAQRAQTLFRAIAKSAHPDLAVNDADRGWRHRLMVKANDAYGQGDLGRLELLLRLARDRAD
jgi:hypothetical protein